MLNYHYTRVYIIYRLQKFKKHYLIKHKTWVLCKTNKQKNIEPTLKTKKHNTNLN